MIGLFLLGLIVLGLAFLLVTWRRPVKAPPGGDVRYEANLELFPAGAETEPLRVIKVGGKLPDPKDRLAKLFEGLGPGDYAEVQVSFQELPAGKAAKLRGYWSSMESKQIPVGSVAEPETSRLGEGQVADRNLRLIRLKAKLDPQEPLFRVQILLHASSTTAARATQIVLGLLTAMSGTFNGANSLGVAGRKVQGLKFYSTDAFSWSRWWFHLRRTTGLFWPARPGTPFFRRPPVAVAGFEGLVQAFAFPWSEHESAAPVRTGMRVPPPPASLPRIEDGDDEAEPEDEEAVEA